MGGGEFLGQDEYLAVDYMTKDYDEGSNYNKQIHRKAQERSKP